MAQYSPEDQLEVVEAELSQVINLSHELVIYLIWFGWQMPTSLGVPPPVTAEYADRLRLALKDC